MPNNKLKQIILPVFSGLLIGLLMPPVEFVAVFLADYGFARFRQIFVKDGYIMGNPWISIVFVFMVIFSLFLLARFNKTFAAVAVLTAIITTALIYGATTTTPFVLN